MLLRSHISRIALLSVALVCGDMQSASAGPLIDWLFGRRSEPAYPVGAPVPIGNAAGYAPYTTGYAPAYSAYSPGYQAAPTFSTPGYAPPAGGQYMPGAPTTYSNVPSFRTNYYRAPVTYFRPVLATDPTTGAQVVRMSPCTSYEYQTQRIPTLGQSVYYGNYGAPTAIPAPAAGPTYTLPQGGIPLSRSLTPPISTRGYGSYTTLQPPMPSNAPITSIPQQPIGQYPTTPYGASPYYGTTAGGCSGGYAAGGSYPQGYEAAPPAYGTPPGLTAPPSPTTAPGIYPPAGQPADPLSSDPADSRPTLSTGSSTDMRDIASVDSARAQLKHITQAERDDLRATARQDYEPSRLQNQPPSMRPIPVPNDFDSQQHWTPGLLRDEDLTAGNLQDAQRVQLAAATAGQGKRIQWASFEDVEPASRAELDDGSASLRIRRRVPTPPADAMEPIDRSPRTGTMIQQPVSRLPNRPAVEKAIDRYPTNNWKAVR